MGTGQEVGTGAGHGGIAYVSQTQFSGFNCRIVLRPFSLLKSEHGLETVRPTSKKWCRALDKREYLVIIKDNFCLFCFEPYVVTPHLNHLDETVQMRGHNI